MLALCVSSQGHFAHRSPSDHEEREADDTGRTGLPRLNVEILLPAGALGWQCHPAAHSEQRTCPPHLLIVHSLT